MPITDDTQLRLYNKALRELGSDKLDSLTEQQERRRVLDDVWGDGAVVNYLLEQGEWNFAMRAVVIEPETAITTDFGFQYAYRKPEDFRRLATLASDAYFYNPLTNRQYADEGGYWLSDTNPLYARFVSSEKGSDDTIWPETFVRLIYLRMAADACDRITNSADRADELNRRAEKQLSEAKANDALAEGVKFPPRSGWARARLG